MGESHCPYVAQHLHEEKPKCSSLDGTCESHCLQCTHNTHGARGSDHANVMGWKEHSEKPPGEMERGLLINFCLVGTIVERWKERPTEGSQPGELAACAQQMPHSEGSSEQCPGVHKLWPPSSDPSFQARDYTTNWPQLPRRPGVLH